ncbi:GH10937 [Drosophila grimshawi]|uniref:GH10937 n=2 Tax=Drosophila grimshawi TaxID=7222 RepID=B4JB79_DROGR|nr:GH10937 [Drosophila grimshawi]
MDSEDTETTHYYLECEGGVEEWHWNQKSTKLLVELYSERRHRFRDPKTRKRALWTEIVDEMEREGYKGINEDICDRKWRNMKKTYRTCRETMKKNGRKRVAWDYYDTFDEMFHNDKSSSSSSMAAIKAENNAVEPQQQLDMCATVDATLLATKPDLSVSQEQQRQLLVLERSRISAIKELSKRIEESNAIQRERNDLLREYLNQF